MPLSIKIDRELCMGSGNCAFHAPNTFDLDDEMKVIVVDAEGDPDEKIRLAVDGCPTLALSIDDAAETLPPFWDELAALGWLGLHLAEDVGGSGYGLPELAVVLEELGRACAPGPFLPTVLASASIDRLADEA